MKIAVEETARHIYYIPDFSEDIKRGVKLLDERFPGWESKVDLGTLDLASGVRCVLGQVFVEDFVNGLAEEHGEHYDGAVDYLFDGNYTQAISHGFCTDTTSYAKEVSKYNEFVKAVDPAYNGDFSSKADSFLWDALGEQWIETIKAKRKAAKAKKK